MRTHLCLGISTVLVGTAFSLSPTAHGAGVVVGGSHLIGTLDYSDTFTGTDAGGKPNRPYIPAVQPDAAYLVENTYGHPQISFDKREGFSFAGDSAGLPGFVQGTPNYPVNLAPNASGAGSDTGFSQTGGGIDYAIPYNGLRLQYFVQVDAVQVGDRIDISSGSAPGIFAPQSLSIFFRGDGSGNASLFNGSVDTAIQTFLPAFNTGITGAGQWYNYAVRYNMPGHEIELYVNEVSKGIIDLTTFAGGIYDGYSNAFVGAGAGLAGGENRTWTDNFQVGSVVPEPGTATICLAGLVGLGATRRKR